MGRFQFPNVMRRILPKREPFTLLVHLGFDCGHPPRDFEVASTGRRDGQTLFVTTRFPGLPSTLWAMKGAIT
jgi:hypothetical protein